METPVQRKAGGNHRLGLVITLAVAALILTFRGFVAHAIPHNSLRIADELLTLQQAEAPLVGLPPMFLSWPAGPSRLAMPLLLIGDFVAGGSHPSIDGFLSYLGQTNREPWHALWILRWFVILVSTGGLCSLIIPLWKRTDNGLGSVACVLLVAFVPICWQRSVMALSDGVAFGFLCLAIAIAVGDNVSRQRVLFSGAVFGLALASKIIVLQAAPFVLILAIDRVESKSRAVLLWSVFVLLGFGLGCPYGIAEPLRMLKSMVGNFVYKETVGAAGQVVSAPVPLRMFLNLHAMLPACYLIVVGFASIIAVRDRRWNLIGAAGAAAFLSGVLVLRSPAFAPGYLLPLAPVLLVFSAIALARFQTAKAHAPVTAVLVLWAALVGWNQVRELDRLDTEYYKGANEAIAYVAGHHELRRMIVPHTLATRMAGMATSRSLLEAAGAIDQALASGTSMRGFLRDRLHLGDAAASSFANHFTEYERNLSGYLRLAAVPVNSATMEISLSGSDVDSSTTRFGACSLQEALARLKAGEVDAVLVECRLEPGLKSGGLLFGGPDALQYRLFTKSDI